MRIKETTIDGRDGSIIEELGYEPYDKPLVIGLHGNFDINKVIKYFTGEGEVVFSNEPDKVYTAKIVGHIDYNRLLRYRQATIIFRTQPFKKKLNEAYKPAPTAVVSGTSIAVNVGENAKIKTFSIYGKTTQDGTPTPNNPVELVSVGGGGSITVSVTDGTETQSVAVQTPNGLPGIPVSSGGNYTDANGQQWVSDEIDLARGVYVQRVGKWVINGKVKPTTFIAGNNGGIVLGYLYTAVMGGISTNRMPKMCDKLQSPTTSYPTSYKDCEVGFWYFNTSGENKPDIFLIFNLGEFASADEAAEYLQKNPIKFIGILATPIETPLSAVELAEYASLHTHSGNATVSNNASTYMGVEYFKPYEVFNEGLESSKPIMVLKGKGTVVVSVNGLEIFEYTFPEGENEVVIDSEKEDAYLGDVLKNRNMNGEFPVLLPGTNIIEWSGYVSSIEILPRSRWL